MLRKTKSYGLVSVALFSSLLIAGNVVKAEETTSASTTTVTSWSTTEQPIITTVPTTTIVSPEEYQDLAHQIEDKKAEVLKTEEQLGQSQNDIATLTTEVDTKTKELEQVETDLSNQSQKQADLVKAQTSQQTVVSSLSSEVDHLQKQVVESPTVVSHRGYNAKYPEGSNLAYSEGIKNGFSEFETDIRFTKDGVPVIHHDSTINRLARNQGGSSINGNKYVGSYTLDELNQYDYGIYKGEEFQGTKLQTFDELIKTLSTLGATSLQVELKDNHSKEQKRLLYDTVAKYHFTDKTTWISFYWDYLDDFKEFNPNSKFVLLAGEKKAGLIDKANSLNNGQKNVAISMFYPVISKALVDEYKSYGYDTYAWTVNDPVTANNLVTMGVKRIITDQGYGIGSQFTNDELVSAYKSKQGFLAEEQQKLASLDKALSAIDMNVLLSKKGQLEAEIKALSEQLHQESKKTESLQILLLQKKSELAELENLLQTYVVADIPKDNLVEEKPILLLDNPSKEAPVKQMNKGTVQNVSVSGSKSEQAVLERSDKNDNVTNNLPETGEYKSVYSLIGIALLAVMGLFGFGKKFVK
ncbi:glycerophosphodiester phosphodiesterase family protein [Streptococcus ovis]|uniref:glycerophosphodiester phosphodiesterase family protein n=1 Tax=Streptococcus ovis TaxID=82806 RepID=UPI00035DF285|nr:glycerophosphodiester phosphodiesterase family protein [Streptococcus ovis]